MDKHRTPDSRHLLLEAHALRLQAAQLTDPALKRALSEVARHHETQASRLTLLLNAG